MTTFLQYALGPILTVVVTSLVTWKVAARSKSGRVDTSEAGELWQAQIGFTGTVTDFAKSVLSEVTGLKAEVEQLRKDAVKSFEDTLDIRRALADAQQENTELRADNQRLRIQITGLELRPTPPGTAMPKGKNNDNDNG